MPILLTILAVIIVFLVIVATRPDQYVVTRSIEISAPPDAIFPHVNDLHQFQVWNPWAKIDPAMKSTFEGPRLGKGAVHAWTGNNNVGEGRMTLTESRPSELVQLHMEFYKPMAGTAEAEFTFRPKGKQTTVTWSMTGKKNFMSKAFCMFISMDKMIGGQFEKGLANMKSVVEASAKS